jgi:hypothetical protein
MDSLVDSILILLLEYLIDCKDIVNASLICTTWSRIIFKETTLSSYLWRKMYGYTCQLEDAPSSRSIDWINKVKDLRSFLRAVEPIRANYLDLPLTNRSGHSLACLNEYIIAFGGATDGYRMTQTIDVLYVDRNEPKVFCVDVRISGDRPPSMWLHTGTTLNINNQKIVIIYGGLSGFGQCNSLVHGIIQHAEGFRFIRLSPDNAHQAQGKAGHSSIMLPDDISSSSILIFGGRINNTEENEEEQYQFTNDLCLLKLTTSSSYHWTTIQPTGQPPTPRWCHSCSLAGESMFIFGGWNQGNGSADYLSPPRHVFLNDLHVFDTRTNTWSEVSTTGIPPSPRCQTPVVHFKHLTSRAHLFTAGYLVFVGGAYHSAEVCILPLLLT